MNDGATADAAAGRVIEGGCDPRAAPLKSVKISVVVSPPRDGPRGEKGLLRRFSVWSRSGGGGGNAGEQEGKGGGGLDAAASSRQLDQIQLAQNTRLQEKIKRQARTHSLLVSIVVVFALSWFPLNVLNIVLDVKGDIFQVRADSRTWYCTCKLNSFQAEWSRAD